MGDGPMDRSVEEDEVTGFEGRRGHSDAVYRLLIGIAGERDAVLSEDREGEPRAVEAEAGSARPEVLEAKKTPRVATSIVGVSAMVVPLPRTTTSPRRKAAWRPPINAISTDRGLAATTGKLVSNETSMSGLPVMPPAFRPDHSHAVGLRTIAIRAARLGSVEESWRAGTHPGYPRLSRFVV